MFRVLWCLNAPSGAVYSATNSYGTRDFADDSRRGTMEFGSKAVFFM